MSTGHIEPEKPWPRIDSATAATLEQILNRLDARTEALKLVLLFYASGHWTDEERNQWANGLTVLLGPAAGRDPEVVGPRSENEATTRNLCCAVRAALKA